MSEVLSHESNDKPFLKTEADIADSLHDQVDVASTGEELLDSVIANSQNRRALRSGGR